MRSSPPHAGRKGRSRLPSLPVRAALSGFRRGTAALRPLPSVLIIGTQKGGTTSLFEYLDHSPSLKGARTKEVRYFTSFHERGVSWYRAQFPLLSGKQGAFEATPCLFHPHAPQWVAETVPSAHFVVLLRDPVARTWSHWRHNKKRGMDDLSFAEAIAEEDWRVEKLRGEGGYGWTDVAYRAKSEYVHQLRAWFAVLPRDRFLIAQSERLFAHPEKTVGGICDWLGAARPEGLTYAPHNRGEDMGEADVETVAHLRRHFAPLNEALFDLIGTRFDWG